MALCSKVEPLLQPPSEAQGVGREVACHLYSEARLEVGA
jgi:hypothetical protein